MQELELELLNKIGGGKNSFQSPSASDADLAFFQTTVETLESLEGDGYIKILDERRDIILLRITPKGQTFLRENAMPSTDEILPDIEG